VGTIIPVMIVIGLIIGFLKVRGGGA